MRLRNFLILLILFLVTSFATIQVSGVKDWSVGWGIGSADLLTSNNHYLGFNLDQNLKASIFGTQYATFSNIPIGIKINGIFNDHNQLYYKLSIDIFKNDYHLLLGDYDYKINQQYIKFGDHLKGVAFKKDGNLNYFLGISQLEGKQQNKVFKGQSLSETLQFNEQNQYLLNSKGLESKKLDFNFTDNYTKVYLKFTDIATLTQYLKKYNMDYLIDFDSTDCTVSIKSDGKYRIPNYVVVPDNILLLTRSSTNILRDAVKYYINRYNEFKGLNQDNKKEYLNENMDAEFLDGLKKYVLLSFAYPDKDYQYTFDRNGLYFDLMNDNLISQSITITTPSSDDTVSYTLLNGKILKINKPLSDFSVEYKYENPNSIYFLGLNVIPNSEKVYLNGSLLTKSIDYYIDYNTGFLTIFKELKDTDTVVVNYQSSITSFGSVQYYNTYVALAALNYKINNLSISLNDLSLLELDSKNDSYNIPEMPNNKNNLDLRIKYNDKNSINIDYEGDFVYQNYKDPSKDKQPLIMKKILKFYDYYIISSNSGILIFKNDQIYHFTTSDGLSSNMVNDMCLTSDNVLYLATDNGISYIDLQDSFGKDPDEIFSKDLYGKDNWNYYDTNSGFESQKVNSITSNGALLYISQNDGIYKLQGKTFTKIYSKGAKKIIFYNNNIYFIDNDTLYKNDEIFLNDVNDIKVHNGTLYIFGQNGVYDLNKSLIKQGNFYDYIQNETKTYYSNSKGLYINSTCISTETYYYITDNIAVGNDIIDLSKIPIVHYKTQIATQYYADKPKEGYKYFQNHLILKYKSITLDLKKDLKDEYAGIGLNAEYEKIKFQLKYYYKRGDRSFYNLYNLYLGADLLNLRASISNVSSSVSLNSKYANPYFVFDNFVKYENHNFYYKIFGENQKKFWIINKLTYNLNNKGTYILANLENDFFSSKNTLFYDKKIENFSTDSKIRYSLGLLDLTSSMKMKYPSTSEHIYMVPSQTVKLNSKIGTFSISASLMKDYGNEDSVDIYPIKAYFLKSFKNIYLKISLDNIYYVNNNKTSQSSKNFKIIFSNKSLSFSTQYDNDQYYNKKYLRTSFSQKLSLQKFGKLQYGLVHYISFISANKANNISGNLQYIKTYQNGPLKISASALVNLKYNFLTSKTDYGIYLGAKAILSF